MHQHGFVDQGVVLVNDLSQAFRVFFPGRGKRAEPAVPYKKRKADFRFDIQNMAAYDGLGFMKNVGSLRKTQCIRESQKCFDLFCIQC